MTAIAVTPEELIDRAAAMGPTLVERQAETEERTSYAPDTHEQFRDAGYYRMLVPRRYGGLEFDIPTFVRVIVHITHGCPSTGWQLCLPTAHALLVAAWFEERAQNELFPDFLCPSVAAPVGQARPTGDGYLELTGTHRYCSGAPYGTHYLGQTLPAAGGPPMLFVAPRSEWTMLDDWGHTLGPQGQRLEQHRLRQGPHPRVLRAARLAHARLRQLPGHGGAAPPRQPHVSRARPELLRP
jgi:3-hydroxy-9,10-secoandrosta-1,3,5(10)-triene-9,17-dione monooxygenase